MGCSLKTASHGSKLSLVVPNPQSYAQLTGPAHSLAPTSWNDTANIKCYAINVVGSGIADSSSHPNPKPDLGQLLTAGGSSCAYRGVVAGPFQFNGNAALTIDLQVPPGPTRVIQLVGIANPAACAASFFDTSSTSSISPEAYELGRVSADLFADTSVSIPITYTSASAASRRVDCGSATATILPTEASAMAWAQASPSNVSSVSVAWAKAASSDLADQKIQLYSDGSCTTPSGSPVDLSSSTAETYSFTSLADGTYSFRIFSLDSASVSTPSGCSPAFVVDTTIPAAATALVWAQTSPFNNLNVTATWTKSASTDLANQQIKYYSGSGCATLLSTIPLTPGTTQQNAWTAPSDGIYSYAIMSVDAAGNSLLSSCSSAMTIDTTPPTLAITSPASGSYVTAANQSSFFLSGTCSETSRAVTITGAATGSATCSSGVWSATLDLSAAAQGTVTLTATHTDLAGNSTTATRSFQKDTVVPTVTIATPAAGSYVNAANVAAFGVSGTCSENGVSVVISGSASATATCNAGTWGTTLNFTSASDGTVTIAIDHTDAAGNVAATASRSFTKDTVVPSLASVTVGGSMPLFSNSFSLGYGTVIGSYAQYCILVNDTNVADCVYNSGTLPSSYVVLPTVSGTKVLSVWLKTASGNVSVRTDSGSATYDASCDTMGGTGANPANAFQIATFTQLTKCLPLKDAPSTFFKIIPATLNISGLTGAIPSLQGTLDGNGSELQSMSLSTTGLFQTVSGTITNLKIYAPTVSCSGSPCGIVSANATGTAVFDKVQFTGPAGVLTSNSYGDVGGMVGKAMGGVSFTNNIVNNLTINSTFSSGGTSGVGGMVGTYIKMSNGAATDFYQNTVSASQYGSSLCATVNSGGMIGYVGFGSPGLSITIDQNSVKFGMPCGSQTVSKFGGLVGLLDFASYPSTTVTVKNSNVQGSISLAGAGSYAGGIIGYATASTGTFQLVLSSNYYGGTFSGTVSPNGAIVGYLSTSQVVTTLTDNVWNNTLAPSFSGAATGTLFVDTANAGFSTSVLTTPTPFTTTGTADWTNAAIWDPASASGPKLAFEP